MNDKYYYCQLSNSIAIHNQTVCFQSFSLRLYLQIELSGNISELYNSQKLQLPLHSNRDNIRDFSIITVDKERSPEGKICIQRHETKIVTETVEEIELGCFGKKNIKVTEVEREREELIKVCSCELRIISLPKGNFAKDILLN